MSLYNVLHFPPKVPCSWNYYLRPSRLRNYQRTLCMFQVQEVAGGWKVRQAFSA